MSTTEQSASTNGAPTTTPATPATRRRAAAAPAAKPERAKRPPPVRLDAPTVQALQQRAQELSAKWGFVPSPPQVISHLLAASKPAQEAPFTLGRSMDGSENATQPQS